MWRTGLDHPAAGTDTRRVTREFHFRGAKRARTARDELGLGQEGPLEDVLESVEQLGGAYVVLLELPEDVAGAFVNRPGMPLLVVSGGDSIPRQRFTLAHEFGHFRMGHDGTVDRQVAVSGYDHDPCEVEANSFAAEFLVPKKALLAWDEARGRRATITLEDVVRLAWEYGVSAQMMRYRLNTCGLLPLGDLQRRLDEEIGEGLHLELGTRLGLDVVEDTLAYERARLPRIPSSLRNSLFGDLLAGEVSAEDFAAEMQTTLEHVESMLLGLGLNGLLPATSAGSAQGRSAIH